VRVFALEAVDPILGVSGNGIDHGKRPSRRELGPVLDEGIRVLPTTDGGHRWFLLGRRHGCPGSVWPAQADEVSVSRPLYQESHGAASCTPCCLCSEHGEAGGDRTSSSLLPVCSHPLIPSPRAPRPAEPPPRLSSVPPVLPDRACAAVPSA